MLATVVVVPDAVGRAAPARLILHTTDGMAVLNPDDGTGLLDVTNGATSPDGTVVVTARPTARGQTLVEAMDLIAGASLWRQRLDGDLSLRVVGDGGRVAVLAPAVGSHAGAVYAPSPKRRSTIVVATATHTEAFDVAGNVEPEAVSVDGTSVFVLSYSPPLAPDRYQVRRLDLTSGDIVDVYTPDAQLQDEMRGSARTQVLSRDGRRLYTLYTLDDGEEPPTAFVHVLSLDGMWAHCVDLPDGFGTGPSGTALALSGDSTTLHAVDTAGSMLVSIDTQALRVRARASLPPGGQGAPSAAVVADRLFVAQGSDLLSFDAGSLALVDARPMTADVRGLDPAPHGLLYVAAATRVEVFDPVSKRAVRTLRPPNAADITGVGPAGAKSGELPALECAC